MMAPDSSIPRVPRGAFALLLCSAVMAGCSSSGDSDADDIESATTSEASGTIDAGGSGAPPAALNDPATPAPPGATETDGGADATGDTDDDTDTAANPDPMPLAPGADPASPAVPDPMTPMSTRVDFAIVVPAYPSDALRVEVVFGGETLVASWEGDEFWSATGTFPTGTEAQLTVTFYDRNGALELAQANRRFSTGSTAAQSVDVPAEQFDACAFDADGDGISNLDKSIRGTDPNVDEDASLEIRDTFWLGQWSRLSVSEDLEARVPDERPSFASLDVTPVDPERGGTSSGRVDIDDAGNGTLDYAYDFFACDRRTLTGTRTVSGDAVTWNAEYSTYDCDYGYRISVVNTVAVVDDTTRTFREDIVGSNVGTFDFRWNTRMALTGDVVPGTSRCRVVAGTITTTDRNDTDGYVAEVSVSKAAGDRYWRVVREPNDGDRIEYFARELEFWYDQTSFTCVFADP